MRTERQASLAGSKKSHDAIGYQTPSLQNSSFAEKEHPLIEEQPIHILVVDDDNLIRELLVTMLLQMGMQASSAVDGSDAQKKIETGSYDLVISDISMPGMDGISLAKWIKEQNSSLEIILISGAHDVDNVVQALRIGVVDFLKKPFTSQELEDSLKRYTIRRSNHCGPALTLIRQALHDVRGSLVAISGLIKMLGQESSRPYLRSKGISLQTLAVQLDRLVSLTENYCAQAMFLTRDENINEEVLDLQEDVINQVLQSLDFEIDQKNISVNSSSFMGGNLQRIKANTLFIRSAFRNLFDNAIKHSPSNGKITYAIKNSGNKFQVLIENDMLPLAGEEKKECAFPRPFPLRSAGGKSTGLGLGLNMTRYFIGLCGGDVSCEPQNNRTRCLLTLPAHD